MQYILQTLLYKKSNYQKKKKKINKRQTENDNYTVQFNTCIKAFPNSFHWFKSLDSSNSILVQ